MKLNIFEGTVMTLLSEYPDVKEYRELIPCLGKEAQKLAGKIIKYHEVVKKYNKDQKNKLRKKQKRWERMGLKSPH